MPPTPVDRPQVAAILTDALTKRPLWTGVRAVVAMGIFFPITFVRVVRATKHSSRKTS